MALNGPMLAVVAPTMHGQPKHMEINTRRMLSLIIEVRFTTQCPTFVVRGPSLLCFSTHLAGPSKRVQLLHCSNSFSEARVQNGRSSVSSLLLLEP
jgi:hypothetical protein